MRHNRHRSLLLQSLQLNSVNRQPMRISRGSSTEHIQLWSYNEISWLCPQTITYQGTMNVDSGVYTHPFPLSKWLEYIYFILASLITLLPRSVDSEFPILYYLFFWRFFNINMTSTLVPLPQPKSTEIHS